MGRIGILPDLLRGKSADGMSSQRRLEFVPLKLGTTWELVPEEGVDFPGAHGEEVVRCIYVDDKVRKGLEEGGDVFYADADASRRRPCSWEEKTGWSRHGG